MQGTERGPAGNGSHVACASPTCRLSFRHSRSDFLQNSRRFCTLDSLCGCPLCSFCPVPGNALEGRAICKPAQATNRPLSSVRLAGAKGQRRSRDVKGRKGCDSHVCTMPRCITGAIACSALRKKLCIPISLALAWLYSLSSPLNWCPGPDSGHTSSRSRSSRGCGTAS
jgi:hypothetical protein